jgi:excisionase family DNA binding protein
VRARPSGNEDLRLVALGASSDALTDPRMAVSPTEAARLAGVGRTLLYRAMGSGELKSLKIHKRRLITLEALRAWLLSHEAAL